jgi:uncharacterized membrane protein
MCTYAINEENQGLVNSSEWDFFAGEGLFVWGVSFFGLFVCLFVFFFVSLFVCLFVFFCWGGLHLVYNLLQMLT